MDLCRLPGMGWEGKPQLSVTGFTGHFETFSGKG